MVSFILIATSAMHDDTALKSLISHERAFAADVAKRGIKDGFLATMDENSIVFGPQPVSGQETYGGMEPTDMQLLWEPWMSGASSDGELGFNVGPYKALDPKNPAAGPRTGMFTSVWKKSAKGWKMVFDCGAPGPAMAVQVYDVKILKTKGKSTLEAMLKADQEVTAHLDADSAFMFPREAVAIGAEAFNNARKLAAGVTFKIVKSGISKSGDLGWVYGETELGGKKGGYSRIWRYTGSHWKVCTEVVLPPR